MRKLLLLLTLFVSFNCIGQVTTAGKLGKLPPYMMNIPAIDVTKDTLGIIPIIDNRLSSEFYFHYNSRPITIQPTKQSFHIDSAYLQLIIQELERHGYELPKIKKPIPIEYSWVTFNTYAPAVSKTNKGDFIIKTDSLTAIKQLWNEIERRRKEHEKTMKELYNLLKTNK